MKDRKNLPLSCPHCGNSLTCKECNQQLRHLTPADLWFSKFFADRGIGVDLEDIDKVIHVYGKGWYITLELKAFSGKRPWHQIKMQNFISNALAKGSTNPQYRGHYVIEMEGNIPSMGVIVRDTKRNKAYNSMDRLIKLLLTGSPEDDF